MPRSILIYAIFLVFITVFSYFFVDQNLTYLKHFYTGFSTTHMLLASSIFFLIIVIHFIFFIVFLLTLFGFKLIASISYLAMSFLILKITKNPLSAAIFALNPLVIMESLVSGHNDIFMMFFALLSLYLLSKGEKIKASIYLFFSILVKYATVFLVPVFVYEFWKIVKSKSIHLGTTYFLASISMFAIFLLSPIREEVYPWYGIWLLTFVSTIPHRRVLLYLSIGLSIGLLLSYLPYMALGSYFGPTPYIKILFIFIPAVVALIFGLRRRVWLKKFFWQ